MKPEYWAFGDCTLTKITTAPPFRENAYIVHHRPSGTQVILDPGDDAATILKTVAAQGNTVTAILLTHAHPDHVASLHAVQAATGAPVWAAANEQPVIDAAAAWADALLGHPIQLPPVATFEGEPHLDWLGQDWLARTAAIATPGHTPGGICYLFDGFAITGDTLFKQGFGRTDFPGGDAETLRASINHFLDVAPPETLLFSGHGPEWSAAHAKTWWSTVGSRIL